MCSCRTQYTESEELQVLALSGSCVLPQSVGYPGSENMRTLGLTLSELGDPKFWRVRSAVHVAAFLAQDVDRYCRVWGLGATQRWLCTPAAHEAMGQDADRGCKV